MTIAEPVEALEVLGAFDAQGAAEAVGMAGDQPASADAAEGSRPETERPAVGFDFQMGFGFDRRRHGFPAAARDMGGSS